MYRWIWRHLPFGLPGKLAGSVLLSAAAITLLWLVVFPWAEPLLPFDDGQVVQDSGVSSSSSPGPSSRPTSHATTAVPGQSDGAGLPGDGQDVPYDTGDESDQPATGPTLSR